MGMLLRRYHKTENPTVEETTNVEENPTVEETTNGEGLVNNARKNSKSDSDDNE
jgi:hypothetical protein